MSNQETSNKPFSLLYMMDTLFGSNEWNSTDHDGRLKCIEDMSYQIESTTKNLISSFRKSALFSEYRNRIQIIIIDELLAINSTDESRMWIGKSANERHENLSKIAKSIVFIANAPFELGIYPEQDRHDIAEKLYSFIKVKDLSSIESMYKYQSDWIDIYEHKSK